eukprot:130451_1
MSSSCKLVLIHITCLLLNLCKSSGGADWNAPNIVIQGGNWVEIPSEIYDGSNPDVYPQPPPPYNDNWKKNDTSIIVLIAAFRETRCKDTLFNLFTKATNPHRVFIGIVQQNRAEEDEDCLHAYCRLMDTEHEHDELQDDDWDASNCPYFLNVKVNRMSDADAKGPVYARALQAELVDAEDFCMQIDAHSDAAPNWDMLMLRQWGRCDNEYAVISTYPSNIRDIGRNSNKHWEMPHLCEASVLGMGQVRNGRAKAAANLQRPIIAPLWAAGLSFARCHAEKRVPNDINLKHVFNGEEFSRGARLWTHGYDVYSPARAYIGTWYQSEKGNKGSWRVNGEELAQSNQRMGTLLKFPGSDQSEEAYKKLGEYGIGKQRTLEQYLEFSGVDTVNRKVDMSDKCIRHWVQWNDEDIKDEIMKMDNHVVDHSKKQKDIALQMPHNNIVMQQIESIEQLVVDKVENTLNESMLNVWLMFSVLCVVAIGGIVYKRK